MLRKLLLWGSENPFLTQRLARLGFVQRAVRRFMPGETSEAAVEEAVRLSESRITSVLTLLGEKVTDATEASEVARHYQGVLEENANRGLEADISVKMTESISGVLMVGATRGELVVFRSPVSNCTLSIPEPELEIPAVKAAREPSDLQRNPR